MVLGQLQDLESLFNNNKEDCQIEEDYQLKKLQNNYNIIVILMVKMVVKF